MGQDAKALASEVLRRWYAAWNAHDADAVAALVSDDVVYEDPTAPEPLMRGRGPVEAWARAAFRAIPDLHLENREEWVTSGEQVIATYFRYTGTFTGVLDPPGRPGFAPTNRRSEIPGMDRSEIRDGLIARHQIFWDTVEVGRQMAFLPARGSAAERLGFRMQHLSAWRMRHRTGPTG